MRTVMRVLFYTFMVACGPILLVVYLLCTSCSVCTSEQTRCVGNTAEICDSRGHWRTMMDCDSVSGPDGEVFMCQTTIDEGEEAYTCLPEETP